MLKAYKELQYAAAIFQDRVGHGISSAGFPGGPRTPVSDFQPPYFPPPFGSAQQTAQVRPIGLQPWSKFPIFGVRILNKAKVKWSTQQPFDQKVLGSIPAAEKFILQGPFKY